MPSFLNPGSPTPGPLASLPAGGATVLLLLVGVAVAYAAFLTILYIFQRHILFRPDPGPPLLAMVGQPDLAALRIATADGLELLAWFVPPTHAVVNPATVGHDAPVVLYLHGNAGHIGHRGERVRRFAQQGWGALLVQYRGYGGNPGTPTEAGLIADGAAGLAELARRGIAPARIVLWGESLGSGVAVALAGAHRVGAVVLETPFTSIAAIARARYPLVPVDRLLKDRFDSLARIAAVTAPILIVQGGRDTIVPPAMGRTLLAAATAPAELWLAPGGGHSDLVQFGMVERVAAFLRTHRMAP